MGQNSIQSQAQPVNCEFCVKFHAKPKKSNRTAPPLIFCIEIGLNVSTDPDLINKTTKKKKKKQKNAKYM